MSAQPHLFFISGLGADGYNLYPFQDPHVLVVMIHPSEEVLNAVDAGKQQPLIPFERMNGPVQGLPVFRRHNFNGGEFHTLGP